MTRLYFNDAVFGDHTIIELTQEALKAPALELLSIRSDNLGSEGRYAVAVAQAKKPSLEILGIRPSVIDRMLATRGVLLSQR